MKTVVVNTDKSGEQKQDIDGGCGRNLGRWTKNVTKYQFFRLLVIIPQFIKGKNRNCTV